VRRLPGVWASVMNARAVRTGARDAAGRSGRWPLSETVPRGLGERGPGLPAAETRRGRHRAPARARDREQEPGQRRAARSGGAGRPARWLLGDGYPGERAELQAGDGYPGDRASWRARDGHFGEPVPRQAGDGQPDEPAAL
jgi:hypothetical protein